MVGDTQVMFGEDIRVMFGEDIRVTAGDTRVTVGDTRVTVGDIRVTVGDIRDVVIQDMARDIQYIRDTHQTKITTMDQELQILLRGV